MRKNTAVSITSAALNPSRWWRRVSCRVFNRWRAENHRCRRKPHRDGARDQPEKGQRATRPRRLHESLDEPQVDQRPADERAGGKLVQLPPDRASPWRGRSGPGDGHRDDRPRADSELLELADEIPCRRVPSRRLLLETSPHDGVELAHVGARSLQRDRLEPPDVVERLRQGTARKRVDAGCRLVQRHAEREEVGPEIHGHRTRVVELFRGHVTPACPAAFPGPCRDESSSG